MRYKIRSPVVLLATLALIAGLGAVVAFAENIDPFNDNSQFAWGENVGWLNAEPLRDGGPGVTVTKPALTGYIWGENIGWISLNCANSTCAGPAGSWGVTKDDAGNLAGYAWGENVGWISFSCQNNPPTCATTGNYGVTIDRVTGIFSGNAWGENMGWITFRDTDPVAYQVRTSEGPKPIGGVGVYPDVGELPLEAAGSSGPNAGVLAGLIAGVTAGAVALGGAAWYLRRQRLR